MSFIQWSGYQVYELSKVRLHRAMLSRQEVRSNGDFTATANRACEQPAISLRFVARQIAALSPQIRTCSKFRANLLRFYRSSCRAIKSLCVNGSLGFRGNDSFVVVYLPEFGHTRK